MVDRLTISPDQFTQLIAHASAGSPNEVCGLIAGNNSSSIDIIPITNTLKSPVRFRMDPKEQIDAMIQIQDRGLELIAIYHSHPAGPAALSSTDLAEITFPEAVQLIISQNNNNWSVKGFIIHLDKIQEVPVIVKSGQQPQP